MVQKSGSPVDMANIPIIYRVLNIPGGWPWDFFPSTVSIFHHLPTTSIRPALGGPNKEARWIKYSTWPKVFCGCGGTMVNLAGNGCLEDHPRTCNWLITMVSFCPLSRVVPLSNGLNGL